MSNQNVAQSDTDYTDDPLHQKWLDECCQLFDDLFEGGMSMAKAAAAVEKQMVPYTRWKAHRKGEPPCRPKSVVRRHPPPGYMDNQLAAELAPPDLAQFPTCRDDIWTT